MTPVQMKIEPLLPEETLEAYETVSTTDGEAWDEAREIRALELRRAAESLVSPEADDLVIALEIRATRREEAELVTLEEAMRRHGFTPDEFQS